MEEIKTCSQAELELDQKTEQLNRILENTKDLVTLVPQVTQQLAMIHNANLQVYTQLEALKIQSATSVEKLRLRVQAAERRLDRELEQLDKLTDILLSTDLSSINPKEMEAQEKLMALIQQTNDRFNNELDKLYSL